MDEEGG